MTEFKRLEIPNFSNYEINFLGEVRNITTLRILKPSPNTGGYLQVPLYNNGTRQLFRIHRLVALAFIPNSDDKLFVDHIDRNRTNNSISNLRWATKAENCQNINVPKNNKSGVIGVSFDNTWNVWVAKRQRRHLGTFKTMEEAIICRNNSDWI